MKLIVDFIDNEIILQNNTIFNIEIENKVYFYRLINELNLLSKSIPSDNIIFLIDSQCYNSTNKFEKKLIIDRNLEEFLL